MEAQYEYEEKLIMQFNSEDIDLLHSGLTKIKTSSEKIGFKKRIVNRDELQVLNNMLNVITECRKEVQDDKQRSKGDDQ